MPGFFYFVPLAPDALVRRKRLQLDVLWPYGLDQVLRDVVHVPDDCVVTPATLQDQPGSMLAPKSLAGSEPREWTYNPAIQTWIIDLAPHSPCDVLGESVPRPAAEASLWIGYETDRPPTPGDLARKLQIGGAIVTDKLDQEWRVPVARSPRGRGQLPAEYVRTPTGVARQVDPEYLALWTLSGKIRDFVHGQLDLGGNREVWTYDAALEILGTNYRLGTLEANLLQQLGRGVLTTATVEPILIAAIDWDLPQQLLDALEKKTETAVDP
jgi:hypothetical protein